MSSLLLLSPCRSHWDLQQAFDVLAWPKGNDDLLGNFHAFTCPRILSTTRPTTASEETSEAAKLNSVAICQGFDDAVKDDLHNLFRLVKRRFGNSGDFLNQIFFPHRPPTRCKVSSPEYVPTAVRDDARQRGLRLRQTLFRVGPQIVDRRGYRARTSNRSSQSVWPEQCA